jgi:hypothetical protein
MEVKDTSLDIIIHAIIFQTLLSIVAQNMLLREVVRLNPYKTPTAWDQILSSLQRYVIKISYYMSVVMPDFEFVCMCKNDRREEKIFVCTYKERLSGHLFSNFTLDLQGHEHTR